MENNKLSHKNPVEDHAATGSFGQREPRQLLKAGFLMLTSAVLGGVAFAIWNKRQIATMKESDSMELRPVHSVDDDAIY